MAHIADLHNRGRVALHQTVDQARGAYSQLINKESRSAEAAFRRQLASRANVKCPACDNKVCTSKCHLCGYFPITIPTADELMATPASTRPPSVASSRMTRNTTSTTGAITEERIAHLEALIMDEKEQQQEILTQVQALRTLLERSQATSAGTTGGGPSHKKMPTHNRLPSKSKKTTRVVGSATGKSK
jgi:hypothetical protein